MGRVSPYAEPTLRKAYASWCNLVLPLRAGRGEDPTAPEFDVWKAAHAAKFKAHRAAIKEASVPATTEKVAPKSGKDLAAFIKLAKKLGIEVEGVGAATEDEPTRVMLTSEEVAERFPESVGINRLLYRLNVEGFLRLDIEGGNEPITKAQSEGHLTTVFGPRA